MSAKHLLVLAAQDAFRPTSRFDLLAEDHVPFDELTSEARFEQRLIDTVTGPEGLSLIFGSAGSGKTSLIAWACHHLPDTHAALRVPVAALEDAGDLRVLAGTVIVAAVRATANLTEEQRTDLSATAADRVSTRPAGKLITGGTIGGAMIPAELNLDLGSLYSEYEREGLPVDRLHGLDRLVSVFAARGKQLLLVLEDTDAMAGGPGEQAERFLAAILILAREFDAPVIVAVQDHHSGPAYDRLRQEGREIVIPALPDTAQALRRIVAHRLHRAELRDVPVGEVLDDDAVNALVSVYDESAGNLRQVLAVLQFALDHAVDEQAELLTFPHVRYGVQAARPVR
jgi:Cdc6-like AAA superfamily ATPase